MAGLRNTAVITAIALALVGAGCGDDDESPPEPVDTAVTQEELDAIPLGTPKEKVFDRLGAEPVSSDVRRGTPTEKNQKTKPPLYTCYRFNVEGGDETNFAELCFKKNRVLKGIVSNVPRDIAPAATTTSAD